MSMLRAFIAVEIPAEMQQNVYKETTNLRKSLDALVRWVPVENMHLTLKFLGDVSPSSVEFLIQMLRNEAESIPCFSLRLTGLSAFPSLKRPRVIYVGVQAPPALDALQRGVESASRRLGYEAEEHPFSAHLTLGRVKQNISATEQQKIRHAIEGTQVDLSGSARVDSVHLYKSELKPSGSVYARLYSAPLRK
ncbi:MAG TPA: RNA 2',3'-cyclic phosphodiesterase [Anaerolineales bacterium]|nr:RNA 2',3'-cyclic phosphodiesterase [Anaerolineales bacterium]